MVSMLGTVPFLLIKLLGNGQKNDLEVQGICRSGKCRAGDANAQCRVHSAQSFPEHDSVFMYFFSLGMILKVSRPFSSFPVSIRSGKRKSIVFIVVSVSVLIHSVVVIIQ